MREQRVAIRRQFEEMVLLPDPLDRAVQRTLAVNEVFVLLECLAADAVPALVESFVDVPRRDDAAHELLDRRPWRDIRGSPSLPRSARYDAPSVRKSTEPTDSRPAS